MRLRRRRRSTKPFFCALAPLLASCQGTIGAPECEMLGGAAPEAPAIVSPTPTLIGAPVIFEPDTLVLEGSAFVDPDPGDSHAETEFEIWGVVNGEKVARVWSATLHRPAELTRVTLGQGTFHNSTALAQEQDYVARVRYRDANGSCAGWSPWSADAALRSDDGSDSLFHSDEFLSFYLEIPPDSWEAIGSEAEPPDCVPFNRRYHRGALRVGEQTFPGVGIRAKGGCGSSRPLDRKTAFKVNLSWDDPEIPGCPDARRLRGLKHLTFNNMVQDPSYLHEILGYRLYQALGVPTPRTNHVLLHVNGELWGTYLLVEAVDRRFLARRFSDNGGALYEGTYWCDLVPENLPVGLDDQGCLERKFKADECSSAKPGQDPYDYTMLADLVARIDSLSPATFYPGVTEFFDFDRFLSMWAADSILAHWDAYEFDIMNNYRVYRDPGSNRWTMLPHGIDQTFGGGVDPWQVSGVLARMCLANSHCANLFADRLHQAINTFETLDLSSLLEATHQRLLPHIQTDPRREKTMDEHLDAVNETRTFILDRPRVIRSMLTQRARAQEPG